ncbi:MAG: NAD(P)/FAD-dependent oxidoreductase [Bacilli bacterium]|nr:NAD(P)/FAD-dependent oxidoreductase [Bacilli bacterium]
MKYDVAIVGAGPCGYMCAYELTKNNPQLKVILIDKGLPIEKRRCPVLLHKLEKCPNGGKLKECFPACSITNGFGGAGAYSDGKFNITSEFGGWLTTYLSEQEVLDLIRYVDEINLQYGATKVLTNPETKEVLDIEKRAMSVGLKLLRSKVRHLGTEENLKILKRISDDLLKKIEIKFCTKVDDLVVEDNVVKGIKLSNGSIIEANNVVLAVGREGSNWLEEIFDEYNVPMKQNQVDIGVRVECPNLVMDEINKNLYEGKFIYRTSTGNTVRTFCSNPGGHVVVENYGGVINVNGHSYSDSSLHSENTNFALLVTHHFDEPFKKPNEYALKVSSLANQLACGSVIVQRFGDLLKGRRTNYDRLREGFVKPTLKEAVPGDLSLCLPQKTMQSIIEMIQVLDNITPGIATEHTLLYGVEAKYYSSHPDIKNTFETSAISHLYVGGDGAGLTRGLAQASACGVHIARSINKEYEK